MGPVGGGQKVKTCLEGGGRQKKFQTHGVPFCSPLISETNDRSLSFQWLEHEINLSFQ